MCIRDSYYPRGGTPSPIAGRDMALRAEIPLGQWVETASRRLAPGGWLTLICGADGLPEVLAAMGAKLGSAAVLPLAPREGRPAPVSYTHLDVYKRQDQSSAELSHLASLLGDGLRCEKVFPIGSRGCATTRPETWR